MDGNIIKGVEGIIDSEINNIGLPDEYIQKLRELYKISLILESRDCSNYDAYSILFAKKIIEVCQYGDEIIRQIINATPEQLQENIHIFEKSTDYNIYYSKTSQQSEEQIKKWEQVKLFFQSGNLDMIRHSIANHIYFNTKIFEYETLLKFVEQLSEEQLQDSMKLDIDKELQRIISFGVNRTDYSNEYNERLSMCYMMINKQGLDDNTRSFYYPIHEVAENLKQLLDSKKIKSNDSPKL